MPVLNGQTLTVMQLSDCQRKLGIVPGAYLPAGGAAGTFLTKLSAANYDVGWAAGPGPVAGNGIVVVGNIVHFAQAGAYTAGAIPFATGVATMGFDAANLFWDAGNTFLGVGTNAPADRLHVARAYADILSHSMSNHLATTSVSGGAKRAVSINLLTAGAANFNAGLLSGGAITCQHAGAGNVVGVNRIIGLEVYHGKSAAGTGNVDSSVGLYLEALNQNAVGTITDTYDLFIAAPIVTGAITNNYALWQDSATAYNYFAGNIAMGAITFVDHVGLRFEKTYNTNSHAVGVEAWVTCNPPGNTAEFNCGGYFKGTTIGAFDFTNTNTAACGVLAIGIHDGTGLCATSTGVFALAQQNDVGGVSAARAFEGRIDANDAGGTIVAAFGVRILTPTLTGAITTYYGCYLQPGGGGTIYGFYQAAATATEYNFLQGNTSIGTATFSATIPMRIQRTFDSTAATYGVYADITQNTAADTAAANVGGFFQLQTSGTKNFTLGTNSVRGVIGSAYHNGTGTVTQAVGGHFYAYKANTGVVTTIIGVRTQVNNSNAINGITTGYGIFVDTPTTTGAINTYYGIYVAAAGGTTKYGIAVVGTADLNYLAGYTALGSASPTSGTFCLFGASVNATSSYRIPTGIQPGAPVIGDCWHDSTQKCICRFIANMTEYDSRVVFTQYQTVTVTNTNAATTLFGNGVGTKTFPANWFVVGKTVRVFLTGIRDWPAAGPTLTFRVILGGVTLSTSAAFTDNLCTNRWWKIEFLLTCRSTGAGGTVIGQGHVFMYKTVAGDTDETVELPMTGTAALNTTLARVLDVTVQPSAADVNQAWVCTNATIEVLA